MNKKLSRALVPVMALSLAAGLLAGCGGGSKEEAPATTQAAASEATTAAGGHQQLSPLPQLLRIPARHLQGIL